MIPECNSSSWTSSERRFGRLRNNGMCLWEVIRNEAYIKRRVLSFALHALIFYRRQASQNGVRDVNTRNEEKICAWPLEQEQPLGDKLKLVEVLEPNL